MDWQQFISGLTIAGVPAVLAVIAIVQLAKQVGLPSSLTGVAAAITGIGLVALIEAVKIWPRLETFATVIVLGPIVGLAGNGLYSQYQKFVATRRKDELAEEQDTIDKAGGQ